jgi:hypothetical protein
MMKRIRASESAKRWETLLDRKMPAQSSSRYAVSASDAGDEDPFDCSNLEVPPSRVMVDRMLTSYIQQWKHLEERKLVDLVDAVDEYNAMDIADDDGTMATGRKRKRAPAVGLNKSPGWHVNRLRLPENFDYAGEKSHPPQDTGGGERVVSLQNTSETLSFERELWKIFQSVPTVEQLENALRQRTKCDNTRKLHAEILESQERFARSDAHALSRLRMNDRHDLPQQAGEHTANVDDDKSMYVTTIRLECWRWQLKRGASPDSDRAELQFLGTQTLQDVHNAIVELARDELWLQSTKSQNLDDSGMFLIEDTFYQTGTIDYVGPIQKWLDDANDESSTPDQSSPRRVFLGLPAKESMTIEPMGSAQLDQISWRLGVRYYHCHHGDVESSVFLTDIRYGPRSTMTPYPILHDVWTESYSTTDCEACRRRPAVLVSSASNEATDGGPRALCKPCCEQLRLPMDDKGVLEKYAIWRDQAELSVGHDVPDSSFSRPHSK